MYHYKESGLDNIWLLNGYSKHDTPYGDGISIHNTEGLHKAIGKWLISLPKPLNGAEFKFLRLEMEITQRTLALHLQSDEQSIRRWEKARSKPVKGPAQLLLRAIYDEYINGDGSVRRIIDRLSTLDEIEAINGHFKESSKGWKSKEEIVFQ